MFSTLFTAVKLTLYHILPVALGLDKFMFLRYAKIKDDQEPITKYAWGRGIDMDISAKFARARIILSCGLILNIYQTI